MTLPCTKTSYSSVRQECFRPGDLSVKTDSTAFNFVISLRTVDPHLASFLPKMVWNFHTVCVSHFPFSQNVLPVRTRSAGKNLSMTQYSKQQLSKKYRFSSNYSILPKVFCKIKKTVSRREDTLQK